jgi:hypothetical protein
MKNERKHKMRVLMHQQQGPLEEQIMSKPGHYRYKKKYLGAECPVKRQASHKLTFILNLMTFQKIVQHQSNKQQTKILSTPTAFLN